MTDAEFEAWVLDDRNFPYRVTLVQITTQTAIYRLATIPYIDGSTVWDDVIATDIIVDESLDNGISVGDFDVYDADQNWTLLNLRGADCKIMVGDARMSAAGGDFKLVASVFVDGVSQKTDNHYSLVIADRASVLDTDFAIGYDNSQPIPFAWGYLRNVEPVITNPLTPMYRFCSGSVLSIDEVRDKGLPSAHVKYLTTASIALSNAVAGFVTGDIGVTRLAPEKWQTETNYAAASSGAGSLRACVAAILLRAGAAIPGFLASSIIMRGYPVGFPDGYGVDLLVRDTDGKTYADILRDVTTECGSSLLRTADGAYVLRYLSMSNPAELVINSDDLFSVADSGAEPVYRQIDVHHTRNWRQQTPGDLAGGVSITDIRKYGAEHYGKISATLSNQPDDEVLSVKINSDGSAAAREIERLAGIYGINRRRYKLLGAGVAMMATIGMLISTDELPRKAMVRVTSKNYTKMLIEMEVIA